MDFMEFFVSFLVLDFSPHALSSLSRKFPNMVDSQSWNSSRKVEGDRLEAKIDHQNELVQELYERLHNLVNNSLERESD